MSPNPPSSFPPLTSFRSSPGVRQIVLGIVLLAITATLLSGCGRSKKETIATAPDLATSATTVLTHLVTVNSINIQVFESFPVQVRVIARGILPNDCTQIDEIHPVRAGNLFHIAITSQSQITDDCHPTPMPFEQTVPLDTENLPAGVYTVDVNGVTDSFELAVDNSVRSAEVETASVPQSEAQTPVQTETAISPETVLPPTPTPTPASTSKYCTDKAEFVADVTVKDDTRIASNQEFVKTWRLRNTGTCTWTSDYQVVFTGGDQMAGASTAPLGQTVAPGATADISVRLVAPAHKGTYTSSWMLQNPAGKRFGIGRKGVEAFWVKIVVPKDASRKASLQGHVWHDLCANAGLSAESPPPGCRTRGDGSYIADGIRDENEPPIGGAMISLGAGICPASSMATTQVDAQGFYEFTELPPGDYCVSIDPTSDYNQLIFLPGEWSFPSDGQHTITLVAGETRKDVDFGWDYQFSP